MGNIKLIFNLISKRGRYLIILIFIISFFELLSVGVISKYFEVATSITSENSSIIISGYDIEFIYFSLIAGFILIIISILSSFSTYLINKYGIKIGFEIAVKIFENYLKDMSKIKNSNPNDFISKIFNETNRFATNVIVQSFHLFNKIIISLLIVSALLYTDYKIALFTGTIILFTAVLYVKLTKSILSKNSTQITFLNNERLKILNETVGGIDYLKTYNKIDTQINHFEKASFEFADRHSVNQTIQTLPKYLLETIFMISIITYATYLNSIGEIELLTSVLFLFGAAGLKLLPSINVIINSISKIRANIDSFNVLKHDIESIVNSSFNTTKITTMNKVVNSIENINLEIKSFGFNQDDILIKNKIFNFQKNKWYILKGESGSGKSTILRLLLKIYTLEKGNIEINNINIDEINLESYYSRIGYVSQNIYLFQGCIDYNISLEKKPNIQKLEQLKKACNINFNNQDLNNLSGGQIQRIGIARALYKDNDVLIIDEAFTGLDENNYNKIMDYIISISKNKIIIEINHSTIIRENTTLINL
jgi:ABC-type bacteriocin/lantibiotic exporter with double-glycine peptidase domain